MIRFEETATDIQGLFVVSKKVRGDKRGYLERLLCINELRSWANRPISQVNRTYTKKRGTMRGLHFQYPPYAEAKFICCLKGKVSDVALDLRKNSNTFGLALNIELDAQIHNAVFLPEGVAHGFQTLTDDVELLYFHSQAYAPKHEAGINILDPILDIKWKLPCGEISERDKNFPLLQDIKGFDL